MAQLFRRFHLRTTLFRVIFPALAILVLAALLATPATAKKDKKKKKAVPAPQQVEAVMNQFFEALKKGDEPGAYAILHERERKYASQEDVTKKFARELWIWPHHLKHDPDTITMTLGEIKEIPSEWQPPVELPEKPKEAPKKSGKKASKNDKLKEGLTSLVKKEQKKREKKSSTPDTWYSVEVTFRMPSNKLREPLGKAVKEYLDKEGLDQKNPEHIKQGINAVFADVRAQLHLEGVKFYMMDLTETHKLAPGKKGFGLVLHYAKTKEKAERAEKYQEALTEAKTLANSDTLPNALFQVKTTLAYNPDGTEAKDLLSQLEARQKALGKITFSHSAMTQTETLHAPVVLANNSQLAFTHLIFQITYLDGAGKTLYTAVQDMEAAGIFNAEDCCKPGFTGAGKVPLAPPQDKLEATKSAKVQPVNLW